MVLKCGLQPRLGHLNTFCIQQFNGCGCSNAPSTAAVTASSSSVSSAAIPLIIGAVVPIKLGFSFGKPKKPTPGSRGLISQPLQAPVSKVLIKPALRTLSTSSSSRTSSPSFLGSSGHHQLISKSSLKSERGIVGPSRNSQLTNTGPSRTPRTNTVTLAQMGVNTGVLGSRSRSSSSTLSATTPTGHIPSEIDAYDLISYPIQSPNPKDIDDSVKLPIKDFGNHIYDYDEDQIIDDNKYDRDESKLFLTPYIKSGQIEEAQELARVQGLSVQGVMDPVLSFSGFLTVKEHLGSNLFFWFFPAATEVESAPVILWLNGGPGASSMFGLFAGHGPFFVDSQHQLQLRKLNWAQNHSVIYIDSPVGTGFSFTEDEEGYARTMGNVIDDLYEGLKQFFLLFPEFQNREFYIAGQSYSGKYAPEIAYRIHCMNQENPDVKINLKGLAIGSGLCDPKSQTDYGEFLYNIGLIDSGDKNYFDSAYKEVTEYINQENWSEAHKVLQHLMIGWPRPIISHFEKVTGYSFNSNFLHENMPERYAYYMNYIQKDFVRHAIHVSDQGFGKDRNRVYMELANDFPKSVKPLVESLLDLNYRILFYAAQLDVVVPHTGIEKFIRSLDWNGAPDYMRASRQIWKVNNEVAGYSKEVKNLVHLLIRNAGHVAPHDQPEWCFDMITKFTRGRHF